LVRKPLGTVEASWRIRAWVCVSLGFWLWPEILFRGATAPATPARVSCAGAAAAARVPGVGEVAAAAVIASPAASRRRDRLRRGVSSRHGAEPPRLLRPCCFSTAPKRTQRPGTRRMAMASSTLWRRGPPCSSRLPLVSHPSLLDKAPPRCVGIVLGASAAARRLRSRGGDKGASTPRRAALGLSQQANADTIASLTSRVVADRAEPRPSLRVASQLRRASRPLADDRGEAKSTRGLRGGPDGSNSARRTSLRSRQRGDLDLLCLSSGSRSVSGNRAAWCGDAKLFARGDADRNAASRRDTSPRRG